LLVEAAPGLYDVSMDHGRAWCGIGAAVAACLLLGLPACGTRGNTSAQGTGRVSPLPSPSNVRPVSDSAATGPEGRALLRQFGLKVLARGSCQHTDSLRTWTLTRGGSEDHWTTGTSFDLTVPGMRRGVLTSTTPKGVTSIRREVVVHGVEYELPPGGDRWLEVGRAGDVAPASARHWVAGELAVARRVRVIATAEVDGVSCTGIEIDIDFPAEWKEDPSGDLFFAVLQDMSTSKAQMARWVAVGSETDVVWIGQSDHLLHEQVDDYVAHAGSWGVLRCHLVHVATDIGKKVVPPITVPSPLLTPSEPV